MDEEVREAMEERRQNCPCAYPIKPHAMKTYGRSGCIDPRILDLGNTLR
jgi:hypothetical protein